MTRAIQYCTLSRPLLEILVPRALGLYIAQTGGVSLVLRIFVAWICVTWMCGFASLGFVDFPRRQPALDYQLAMPGLLSVMK